MGCMSGRERECGRGRESYAGCVSEACCDFGEDLFSIYYIDFDCKEWNAWLCLIVRGLGSGNIS